MAASKSVPKMVPQVICGPLHQQNKAAMEWSWQGPLAYGCQDFVVIVDPRSAQNLQTLHGHNATVIKVRWSRQLYHNNIASPNILRLASVDAVSQCFVWDAGQATSICNFSLGNKPVVDMHWLTINDSCRDLLAVVASPGTLTLWNADTGSRLTRFSFSETICSFAFNPFQPEQLVLLSPECFVFISDFNPSRSNLSGGGKRLYMNMPAQSQGSKTPQRLLSGESVKTEGSLSLVDCLQIVFSLSVRNYLFLLYAREILIIDTEILQAVGSIYLERGFAPFLQIVPCAQRDILYCLHENGCITVRIREPMELPPKKVLTPADFRESIEIHYNLHCQSEPFRISKSCHPFALAVCPTTELQAAILTSEGRVTFWHSIFQKIGVYGEAEDDAQLTLISALPTNGSISSIGNDEGRITLSQSVAPHWFVPPEGPDVYSLLSMQLLLAGVYFPLAQSPTTIKMSPPLTTRNWLYYHAFLGVGNTAGAIQVYDLATRQLYKEFMVHTCPVRGVEWVNHNLLLSYGYPSVNSSGLVRNELAVLYMDTGKVVQLKKSDSGYHNPIVAVRVSPHKHYFVVNIKDSPPEFWDLKTLKLLRLLESKPAVFSVIEWANVNAFPSFVAKVTSQATESRESDSFSSLDGHTKSQESRSQSSEKEICTIVDETANIHHVIVDKPGFDVGPYKSVQSALNRPTAMAWKSEVVVIGDSEGTIMVWDVAKSTVKYVEVPSKSPVRKMKFGPGKGNKRLLVLFNNRLEIQDVFEEKLLSHIKWGKEDISVEDADWCASDKPVCLLGDGTIRVFDIKLSICNTSHSCTDYQVPVFLPQTMLPQSTLRFKCILQHQPWNSHYHLQHTDPDADPVEKGLSVLLQAMPRDYHDELINASFGTPQRCLLAASLFGDEREIQFWSVALYHILRENQRRQDPRYKLYQTTTPQNPTSDFIRPDVHASTGISSQSSEDFDGVFDNKVAGTEAMLQEAQNKTWKLVPPLDLCHDLFMDKNIYQRYQLYLALCHDSRRHTTAQTRKCAETLLLLGQTDRAVQLLLETDSGSSDYFSDALKACLAATIRSSGASQSTIKLVATSLIANTMLKDGVQLLCLIDKGLDACRYLQTYGEWYDSVWLAKSTLSEKDDSEVLLRWAEHLTSTSVNQKGKALQTLIATGHFYKVVEGLYSMRHFDQAALFLESCLECGLVENTAETGPLIQAVFLEYARYLESLGFTRGMRYYCELAGQNGVLLLQQHFSPQRSLAHTTSTN